MKNIKILFSVLLALCMILSICACGTEKENNENDPQNDPVADTTKDTANDTTEAEEPAPAAFNVTVVDASGNPVQGVMIQICKDVCIPAMTNAEGVATFSLEITDGHKLSVLSCPEGYEYTGDAEVYLESGITEYTVELSEVQG